MKYSMYVIFLTSFAVINSMEKKPDISKQPELIKQALQFNGKSDNADKFNKIVKNIKKLNSAQKQALLSKTQPLLFTKDLDISPSKEINQ